MSRRRYLSTEISFDKAVHRLITQGGEFAGLLYTWMIPHAEDDGSITADPEELMARIMPLRRDKGTEEVKNALKMMVDCDLLITSVDKLFFPTESFYKYQTYIPKEKRPPQNTAKHRKTPQNTSSLSPSPSPSPSLKDPPSVAVDKSKTVDKSKSKAGLSEGLKAVTDKLYNSDAQRFRRLIQWIKKQQAENFEDQDIQAALETLAVREAKIGVVNDWWAYLEGMNGTSQTMVSRLRTKRLQGESAKFKSRGPVSIGQIAGLAELAAQGKKK